MTDPGGPSVQLSRELFVTTDYFLLQFFSGDRRPFLAFLQPTPCLIFPPSFFILSPSIYLSIHLSITSQSFTTLWEPISPTISPQATVGVEGMVSQSPKKPVVSIPDALSEIIRTFISIREHGSIRYGSHNWHLELERFTSPDTSLGKLDVLDAMFSQALSSLHWRAVSFPCLFSN